MTETITVLTKRFIIFIKKYCSQEIVYRYICSLLNHEPIFLSASDTSNIIVLNEAHPLLCNCYNISFSLSQLANAFLLTYSGMDCALANAGENDRAWEYIESVADIVYSNRIGESIKVFVDGLEDVTILTVIAGENYEKGHCNRNSILVLPHECIEEHKLPPGSNIFSRDAWTALSIENIHGIRKLLNCTDEKQCLLGCPVQVEDNVVLKIVGTGYRNTVANYGSLIVFVSPVEWGISVPDDSGKGTAQETSFVIRYYRGIFCLPKIPNVDLLRIALDRYMLEHPEHKNVVVETCSSIVETIHHGFSVIWLPCNIAKKEAQRFCGLKRGYFFDPPMPDPLSNFITNYTNVDGALLFEIETGCCLSFGVIVGGTETEGQRDRGSRLLSSRDYAISIVKKYEEEAKDGFILVFSDDQMIDLISFTSIYEELASKNAEKSTQ